MPLSGIVKGNWGGWLHCVVDLIMSSDFCGIRLLVIFPLCKRGVQARNLDMFARLRCWTGTLGTPTKHLLRLEPECTTLFFRLPSHQCVVSYITEISLYVTCSNKSNRLKPTVPNLGDCFDRFFVGRLFSRSIHVKSFDDRSARFSGVTFCDRWSVGWSMIDRLDQINDLISNECRPLIGRQSAESKIAGRCHFISESSAITRYMSSFGRWSLDCPIISIVSSNIHNIY